MRKSPEIVFRGIDHSEAVETAVQKRIDKLGDRYSEIIGCTATIDAPHQHGNKGHVYSVAIDITVPGSELVVSREKQKNHAHEDVYVAIRDSFNAMERQLKKHFSKGRRQDVKTHDGPPRGYIDRLFEGESYGFIATADGRHIYFQDGALADVDFVELEVGDTVEFVERQGDDGPQASLVRRLNR